MKTISSIVALVFLLACAPLAEAALPPVFSGVVSDPKGDLLGLSDAADIHKKRSSSLVILIKKHDAQRKILRKIDIWHAESSY
jgi:hypothetical protein